MAHISYTRQVRLSNRDSLSSVMPLNLELNNFAVFCGTPEQRINVTMHALARYAGRVGIIVIHDSSYIPDRLATLPTITGRQNLRVMSDRGKLYDPLYGLSANAIIELLAPKDPSNPLSHTVDQLRSGLLAYLEIMQYRFDQGQGPFGKYPFNLNLLLQLTEMSYQTLERSVLDYMPENLAAAIKTELNVANIQQSVYACVKSFALTMREYLWQGGDFSNHSCISIIEAAATRQVISVRVPNSNHDILRYIDAELQVLSNLEIPFLLVSASLDLSEHPAMKKWFLNEHVEKNYYTAVVSDSISSLLRSDESGDKLFSQYQQIFIFRCASSAQAKRFSEQFNEYQRIVYEYTHSKTREPFHLFASHNRGINETERETHSISHNDLTSLGDGVLLCGSAYNTPVLINHFNINVGGTKRGFLLPRL